MGFQLLYNPLSGRLIRQGSVLHMKLIRDGIMDENGQDLTKPKEQEKKVKENEDIINDKGVKYKIKRLSSN